MYLLSLLCMYSTTVSVVEMAHYNLVFLIFGHRCVPSMGLTSWNTSVATAVQWLSFSVLEQHISAMLVMMISKEWPAFLKKSSHTVLRVCVQYCQLTVMVPMLLSCKLFPVMEDGSWWLSECDKKQRSCEGLRTSNEASPEEGEECLLRIREACCRGRKHKSYEF